MVGRIHHLLSFVETMNLINEQHCFSFQYSFIILGCFNAAPDISCATISGWQLHEPPMLTLLAAAMSYHPCQSRLCKNSQKHYIKQKWHTLTVLSINSHSICIFSRQSFTLPQPGGPQRMREIKWHVSISLLIALPCFKISGCPTISPTSLGRTSSARGMSKEPSGSCELLGFIVGMALALIWDLLSILFWYSFLKLLFEVSFENVIFFFEIKIPLCPLVWERLFKNFSHEPWMSDDFGIFGWLSLSVNVTTIFVISINSLTINIPLQIPFMDFFFKGGVLIKDQSFCRLPLKIVFFL